MNAPAKIAVLSALFASALSAHATIINLDLLGKAGVGLLGGNETPGSPITPGSGGEIGAGIFFNDATLELTINVGWGSGQGFTDLSSPINGSHLHGATASSAPGSFNEVATIAFTLTPTGGSSQSNGTISQTVTLSSTQATDLLAGKFYINVHTNTNSGGEIRGNIVVPEPASWTLMSVGLLGLARRRRRA